MMHCGSLKTNSAAARVYRVLREANGAWIDGWTLSTMAHTTAVSTRKCEVNQQLVGERLECERRRDGFYYRWVRLNEQTELPMTG